MQDDDPLSAVEPAGADVTGQVGHRPHQPGPGARPAQGGAAGARRQPERDSPARGGRGAHGDPLARLQPGRGHRRHQVQRRPLLAHQHVAQQGGVLGGERPVGNRGVVHHPVPEREDARLEARVGPGGVGQLRVEAFDHVALTTLQELLLEQPEAQPVVQQRPVRVRGDALAELPPDVRDRAQDHRAVGVDHRRGIGRPEVPPVLAAGSVVQRGRDVAVVRALGDEHPLAHHVDEGVVVGLPPGGAGLVAGRLGHLHRALHAGRGPEVVPRDVPGGELVVGRLLNGGHEAQRVAGPLALEPGHGLPHRRERLGGEPRVARAPHVLAEREQGLAEAVVLLGPVDEQAVVALPGEDEVEVLAHQLRQAHQQVHLVGDRAVPQEELVVAHLVDQLHPLAGAGQGVARQGVLDDAGVEGVDHLGLGQRHPHHGTQQAPPEPQRDRPVLLVAGGGDGAEVGIRGRHRLHGHGEAQRPALMRPQRQRVGGAAPLRAGVERHELGLQLLAEAHARAAVREQDQCLAIADQGRSLERVYGVGVESHARLPVEPIAGGGARPREAIDSQAAAVDARAVLAAVVDDGGPHASVRGVRAQVGGLDTGEGDGTPGHRRLEGLELVQDAAVHPEQADDRVTVQRQGVCDRIELVAAAHGEVQLRPAGEQVALGRDLRSLGLARIAQLVGGGDQERERWRGRRQGAQRRRRGGRHQGERHPDSQAQDPSPVEHRRRVAMRLAECDAAASGTGTGCLYPC